MSLNCLNDIITDNLAIHIDLSDNESWDLNTGLTSYSLTKWSGAVSSNLDINDFGLTAFDNGRTDEMWSGIEYTPKDTLFSMYRVGYNLISNPTTGETSGATITTEYLPMSAVTTGVTGNHFDLIGGYLQGFFKLDGYDYELFPSRSNFGITVETLVYLYPDTQGIFYLMGTRSEDKYNEHFSGETVDVGGMRSGVVTSEWNTLDSINEESVRKLAFRDFADSTETKYTQILQSGNTKNNIISFEVTNDKKIKYQYFNNNNELVTDTSLRAINPSTGWSLISISFTPDNIIYDGSLKCTKQRKGTLNVSVNGRSLWMVKSFPEIMFSSINNSRDKQVGVPYNISWGGGSFGLKHSWHYDQQTYGLYDVGDQTYIDDNFVVKSDPTPSECDSIGDVILSGLTLSADTTSFTTFDDCGVVQPMPVMRIEQLSGNTGNTYFVKFVEDLTVLSNRVYDVNFSVYIDGFFKMYDNSNNFTRNKITAYVYGDVDVTLVEEVEYVYPYTSESSDIIAGMETLSIDGDTIVTGQNSWLPISYRFKTADDSGKQNVSIGILIETSYQLNDYEPLFINNFTYTGADVYSQDQRKEDLLIEQNFDSSFNGKIQKLRIYDRGLTSQETLHNALIEKNKNTNYNLEISKGGRIIYR